MSYFDTPPSANPSNPADAVPPVPPTNVQTNAQTNAANMTTPGMSTLHESDMLLQKKFGLTADQVGRAKILRQMGVTEEDLVIASKIMSCSPPQPTRRGSTKVENVLGYDVSRINRERALKRLGISEEELDVENAKNLGSLGRDARKRSFLDSGSGARLDRSWSEPVLKTTNNRKQGKRGSWFSRRSSANSNSTEDSPRRNSILSAFDGWNCMAGDASVASPQEIIETLQRRIDQDARTIDELKYRIHVLEEENANTTHTADAGAGAATAASLQGVEVASAQGVEKGKGWFS
jgi:hypothetical protein